MRKTLRKATSLTLALLMCVSLFAFSTPASAEAAQVLRPMEYLTRGLVAAQVEGGMYLSWRFLGNEPDGISWNVYRDGVKIATVAPRDVQPESSYAENPGIVKENTTPTNYTDPDGVIASVYEVAPVIGGIEGQKQGMSVPVLSALAGGSGQGNRGAVQYIPLKPAPSSVPLPAWSYRGSRTGNISANNMVIPGTEGWSGNTSGQHWYVVDMDLLKTVREPYQTGAVVEQSVIDAFVSKINTYNTTANALGVKTYETAAWAPVNALVDGKITKALFDELEAEFIKYVENLDCGTKLPYYMNGSSIYTSNSSGYSTHDMSVGDFDGDGEYEIVMKWRSSSPDPMYSEPIYSGGSIGNAPEYYDVYKLDGTLLFRVDTGYNYTSGNDHESPILVGDFDGDGKSELMLKTGLGARIGNWDEEAQAVVYPDTANTVVGGELGLNATTDKFKEYFAAGNTTALDQFWGVMNSFTICYRTPQSGGNLGPVATQISNSGNDGANAPEYKRWIKTYHLGRMGLSKDDNEFMSAFEYDAAAGKGVLIDSAKYPFPFRASVDGENWAMNPCTQRGNYCYVSFPLVSQGSGGAGDAYKSQIMQLKENYWIRNPWKAAKWGDAQGNRANRYCGVVACLDGENWYAVSQRGYYERTTYSAFNIVDGKVNLQAAFDSKDPQYWSLGGEAYDYQNRGAHHTNSGDVNGDGKDEIVMIGMVLGMNAAKNKILPMVINGETMPSDAFMKDTVANGYPPLGYEFGTAAIRNDPRNIWAPFRHGDREALLPRDKTNKIVQWSGAEEWFLDDIRTGEVYGYLTGVQAHDPLEGRKRDANGNIVQTNSLIYSTYTQSDDEGSVAGNFSNRWPGAQGGTSSSTTKPKSLINGEFVGTGNSARGITQGQNAIWFGGGLTHMGVSSATINSINDETFAATAYLATGLTSTGNKSTPTLKADLLGDWREELVLRASGNRLAIVTTLAPTEYGIRTLMHDPMYRQGVANTNAGYNQIGFASFYLGDEAPLPAQRTDIYIPQPEIPSAPAMPANVEYSPVTEDSVTIKWDAVDGADGYHIYRRDSKGGSAERIATINSAGYVDNAVELGTDYWYSVSAYNDAGESAKTMEAFIALANDDAVLINSFQAKVRGSRLRLGDLDGDGRTDILVCHTTRQSNYSLNGSVIYVLIAYNLEGEILWEYSIDPAYDPENPNTGVVSTSSDEPVNIADVNGDGLNEVVAMMHPSKDRGTNYTGAIIVVLDGRTGKPMKDTAGNDCYKPLASVTVPGLTSTGSGTGSINCLGDAFSFGNFDGRATDNQFLVLKSRYENVTILEMFDKDGKFNCDYVYRFATKNPGQTLDGRNPFTFAGHYSLVVDLDGDRVDELIISYSTFKVKTDEDGNVVRHAADATTGNAGQPVVEPFWWCNAELVKRSGPAGDPLNDDTPVYYPGTTTQIKPTDHCDTIQVGYIMGEDQPLCVMFGGGGPDGAGSVADMTRTSTFCYTWDGKFLWCSNSAIEPQSLNLAQFRTDHDGLMTYGLDRRTRGAASNSGWGKDSMFTIGSDGNLLQLEYPFEATPEQPLNGNPMGWSSIVIRVDNWTGTYAPLCLSFNRNTESRAAARDYSYPAGAGNSGAANRATRKALWMTDYREPGLYDGYFNTLFKMGVPMEDRDYMFENNVDWRYMAMDLCGDSRTELVGYDDSGRIRIYYNNANGDIKVDEAGNLNEADRIEVLRSGITGEPKPQTYFMANYSRYPHDVYFDDMTTRTPAQPHAENVTATSAYIDWTPIINASGYTLYRNGEKLGDFTAVGYQDDAIVPGVEYKYTVTATGVKGVSKVSLPLVLNTGDQAAILGVSVDSRIVNLVNGCAANIPVTVNANNPDTLNIFAGLFVDDVLAASAKTVNGQATIKAGAFSTASANVYVKAWFEGEEPAVSKAIPVKQLPTDIWKAEVDVNSPEGQTVVFFAENISFNATAAMTINGVKAPGFAADGPKLTINAGSVAGDVVVMKGVKYPALFPSYSFTFTSVRGETPVVPDFETMKFQFGIASSMVKYEDWTSVTITGTGNVNNGAPSSPYTVEQGWGIVPRGSNNFQGRTRSGGTALTNSWVGGGGTANGTWQFKVNVPNGTYKASVYGNDIGGTNNITIDVNGVTASGSRNNSNMEPFVLENVVVADGVMSFTFGGSQAYVNGIIIEAD